MKNKLGIFFFFPDKHKLRLSALLDKVKTFFGVITCSDNADAFYAAACTMISVFSITLAEY